MIAKGDENSMAIDLQSMQVQNKIKKTSLKAHVFHQSLIDVFSFPSLACPRFGQIFYKKGIVFFAVRIPSPESRIYISIELTRAIEPTLALGRESGEQQVTPKPRYT